MIEKIRVLDDWLMDKHESVSHYIQRLTGYSCFKQAKITSVAALLCYGLFIIGDKKVDLIPNVAAIFPWVIIFFVIYYLAEVSDKEYREVKMEEMTANSARPLFFMHRVLLLLADVSMFLLVVILPGKIAGTAFCLLLLFSVYLVCCTPLPPCRGKLGEFINSFILLSGVSA